MFFLDMIANNVDLDQTFICFGKIRGLKKCYTVTWRTLEVLNCADYREWYHFKLEV